MTYKLYNKPTKPNELIVLDLLKPRISLPQDNLNTLENLQKGFHGEQKLHKLLSDGLKNNCIALYDLLLKTSETVFQIDSLLIFQNEIYLLEVKNYHGDFNIKDNAWYNLPTRKEVRNPFLQLERSEFLLRQLLQKLGYKISLKSFVVFVNAEFTLYNAPLKLPIIFPSQLHRFIKKLNEPEGTLTSKHSKLAEQLINAQSEQIYNRLPSYDIDQLEKGIICTKCNSFMSFFNYRKVMCKTCGSPESIDSAMLRTIVEFNILFPDKKITTSAMINWCKIIKSRRITKRILDKYLIPIGKNKHLHFVFNGDVREEQERTGEERAGQNRT